MAQFPGKQKARGSQNLTVQKMKDEIQKTFAQIAPGVSLSFDADIQLASFRRGPKLTVGELKKMPEGSVVWAHYQEHGAPRPRIDSAFRIYPGADGTIGLNDGSSFGADFDPSGLKDSDECVDDKCGEGDMILYKAVGRPR